MAAWIEGEFGCECTHVYVPLNSSETVTRLLIGYAKPLQWCLTLCDPVDCIPPGSSVHGILQAGILEWVAISGDGPNPGIKLANLMSSALTGGFFITSSLISYTTIQNKQ